LVGHAHAWKSGPGSLSYENPAVSWTVFVSSGIALVAGRAARQFRAGAATNITPWLGISTNGGMQDHLPQHVHDELHSRALVLDDGKTRLALVTVDSFMVPRQILDAAKKLIHQHTSLPIENILISATHTVGTATPGVPK
jgi:neutral ceramidase